jgi:hypothetical protein
MVEDTVHNRLVAVREDHTSPSPSTVANTICGVPLGGSVGGAAGEGHVLVEGADFYSSPRVSDCGRWLAWVQWDHPSMPWDETELWVGELDSEDGSVKDSRKVAGGEGGEAAMQPLWSPSEVNSQVREREWEGVCMWAVLVRRAREEIEYRARWFSRAVHTWILGVAHCHECVPIPSTHPVHSVHVSLIPTAHFTGGIPRALLPLGPVGGVVEPPQILHRHG